MSSVGASVRLLKGSAKKRRLQIVRGEELWVSGTENGCAPEVGWGGEGRPEKGRSCSLGGTVGCRKGG